MPSLTKQHVKIISTALKNQSSRVKATPTWRKLVDEYGLGEMRGSHIHLTRQDRKAWRELLVAECGFDPTQEGLSGNRTEVASRTPNEKWSTESVWANMVSVTALGGDLVTAEGRCGIVHGVEYRVQSAALQPSDYEALLIVENYEAFLFIHQFQLPELGHVLVLYRGHDATARAVMRLLERVAGIPIIGFTDPDPAGIGILVDNPRFTHALVPGITALASAPTLAERFALQLAARPRLKEQCTERSEDFRHYVDWVLEEGVAISQEWLLGHCVPVQIIPLLP